MADYKCCEVKSSRNGRCYSLDIMLDLDFLEIGTCDFDTLIQQSNDKTVGISVEPLKFYLDALPNRKNVQKINCAISFDNLESNIEVYYIEPEEIIKNKLPSWIKGCNCINDYHPKIKRKKLQHLCRKITVKQYPISTFLQNQNIRKIKYLKLDTEGGDSFILLHLLDYLKTKNNLYYPLKIKFESNNLTSKKLVKKVITEYAQIGYQLDYSNKNTQLTYKLPQK